MKLLKNNQLALQKRDLLPVVHVPVEGDLFKRIKFLPTKSGDGHFAEVDMPGYPKILGSKYSECKLVERQTADVPEHKNCFYYAFGFDTGAYLRDILKKLPGSAILICMEPCPELFYSLCRTVDISDVIADTRLHIIFAADPEQMKARIRSVAGKMMCCERSLYLRREGAFLPEDFPEAEWKSAVTQRVKDSVQFQSMSFNTADVSIRNYFVNAYTSICCHDWKGLRRWMAGRPLLVVGIGPSLEFEMENLRKLQGRVPIACVDNALRTLLHRGIQPDFVLQVEWQEHSKRFYEGLDIPSSTTLVFIGGIFPGILNSWPGPKLSYPNYQVGAVLGEFLDSNVHAFMGTSVGIMAIQFAVVSGASPIYLVGFDFASPMASYFHPGSITLMEAYPTTTRFWSIERMDYDHNKKQQETIEVPGNDGLPIWTAMSVEMDKRGMEGYLKKMPPNREIFNCSRHGNPMEGVDYKALDELVTKYSGDTREREAFVPDEHTVDDTRLLDVLDRKSGELSFYYEHLGRLNECAEKIKAAKESGDISALDVARKGFLEALDELHGGSCGWVEHLFATLDLRMKHVYDAEVIRKKDLATKEERMDAWVDVILHYEPAYRSFKTFIEQFLAYIKDQAKTGGA